MAAAAPDRLVGPGRGAAAGPRPRRSRWSTRSASSAWPASRSAPTCSATVTGAVQLPALLPGRRRRRVSACSCTRSTRRTGTASPIRPWPRRSTSRPSSARAWPRWWRTGSSSRAPACVSVLEPRRRHAAAAPPADAGVLGRRPRPRPSAARRTTSVRAHVVRLAHLRAGRRSRSLIDARRCRRASSSAPTPRSSPRRPATSSTSCTSSTPSSPEVLTAIRTTNAVEFLGLPHAPEGAA